MFVGKNCQMNITWCSFDLQMTCMYFINILCLMSCLMSIDSSKLHCIMTFHKLERKWLNNYFCWSKLHTIVTFKLAFIKRHLTIGIKHSPKGIWQQWISLPHWLFINTCPDSIKLLAQCCPWLASAPLMGHMWHKQNVYDTSGPTVAHWWQNVLGGVVI